MNLINKQVTHKSFGKGSIVKHTDSRIEIKFVSGNKKFLFPDAFVRYLALTDPKDADSVKKMIQKKQNERMQEELLLEKERELQRKEQQRAIQREKFVVHPNSQAAFWCEEEEQNKIFADCRVFAGVVKSGSKKGEPNRPTRLNQNSACLLTARDPGMSEKHRYIVGVFMVNEDFIGKLCEDGYVTAHSEYMLQLSKQESEKMLFWNYYLNEKYPNNMTWNTGKYRYFNNIWMAQILKDIVSLKKDPKEQQFVQNFYEHFCQINRIEQKELPKAAGALMRI